MRNTPPLALFVVALTLWGSFACNDIEKSAAAAAPAEQSPDAAVILPNAPDSFKFAVLGDFGTGDKTQYELADQMAKLHDRFNYGIVILVGDWLILLDTHAHVVADYIDNALPK